MPTTESVLSDCSLFYDKNRPLHGDLPGGPVVKTLPSNAGGMGLIPGLGATIPHASQPKNQKQKTEAGL